MRTYPIFSKRVSHDLNCIWDFRFIESPEPEDFNPGLVKYNDRLPVPSAFDAFPSYAGSRGLGVYRCFVDVTPGKESLLKCGGAGMTCSVYVDGVLIGRHIGTYTPFEVKLPASEQRQREIVVVTDNRYDYKKNPLHENFFDFYNYGGIIRQTWLEELPAGPVIRNARVVTRDPATGEIMVAVDFYDAPAPVSFSVDGNGFQNAEITARADRTVEFKAFVPDPAMWSVKSPNLHLITVVSGDDSVTARFGLRCVVADKGKILINGEPVKLLGYCRHEAHPQFGPATPESLMVSDLQQLRDMGCNFIRGAHYQQDPRFLDLCDEMGFLVFSESLGWGQTEKQLSDRNFIDAQLEQTAAMVLTDFNHPSVIIWGFLNEGASDLECARDCYTGLINLIRSLDPSRLVSYASNRYRNDLFFDQVDVISCNFYPGWYSSAPEVARPLDEVQPGIHKMLSDIQEMGFSDKPFIISEIGAGAIYGFRDQLNGLWTEEYQAEVLRLVCEETLANENIAGLSIWQFCDIRTYQGSRVFGRPRGFNNKGSFDEYRRPKKARDVVKGIFNRSV